MLPSSRRQLTVMVNSNFASSSIGQPNSAWPRPPTGPQVFTGLDLSTVRQQLLQLRAPHKQVSGLNVLKIPFREVSPELAHVFGRLKVTTS
jgi:hypothetical protein